MGKICSKCNIDKRIEEFSLAKSNIDGRCGNCKKCRSQYNSEYRIKNLEILKQKDKKRKNTDNTRKQRKVYYSKNKNKIREKARIKYYKNPEKMRLKGREFRKNKREEKLRQQEEIKKLFITVEFPIDYKICNLCKYLKHENEFLLHKSRGKMVRCGRCNKCRNLKDRENRKKKYLTNIQYNCKTRYRKRINSMYRKIKNGIIVKPRSQDLIGCSWEFFHIFIKSQFINNMTEEFLIKGDIELDHWFPCQGFDLTNIEEARLCFSWTNMRPEWYDINSSKNDKYPDGTSSRTYPNKYSLIEKKKLIYERISKLQLPEGYKQFLPIDYYEILQSFGEKQQFDDFL